MSANKGAEMCAKGVIWGCLKREKGGVMGVFLASKGAKKALFGVRKGEMEVAEVEFWPISDKMS